MKLPGITIVKYFQLMLVFVAVACVGIFMGEKGLREKRGLEDKKALIESENRVLAGEIRSLERDVTLLRSDRKTIQKVAKKKLGMARPDETVYILSAAKKVSPRGHDSSGALGNQANLP